MKIDPAHGFVNYRSKADAQDAGLIKTNANDVFIGVDSTTNRPGDNGRSSVRLESKARYNSGLFIADFSHLPAPVCGSWPAFWMFGPDWPRNGELDIYENWNEATKNAITAHTDKASVAGACKLDSSLFSGTKTTTDCWIEGNEFYNQGCNVEENGGQWGSSTGGVYAIEWTDAAIKVWSWAPNAIPVNIASGAPEPATWGTPHFAVANTTCAIDTAFNNMQFVLNIDFCGDAAGSDGLWGNGYGCQAKTLKSCRDYVNQNPADFKDVYWGIKSIKVYE
ncbi:concanavalin A-like lectin/glucanase domain-containing protein, partial [Lasiosphaeris hirsuta]